LCTTALPLPSAAVAASLAEVLRSRPCATRPPLNHPPKMRSLLAPYCVTSGAMLCVPCPSFLQLASYLPYTLYPIIYTNSCRASHLHWQAEQGDERAGCERPFHAVWLRAGRLPASRCESGAALVWATRLSLGCVWLAWATCAEKHDSCDFQSQRTGPALCRFCASSSAQREKKSAM
jgi:hypothetical protein